MESIVVASIIFLLIGIGSGVGVAVRTHRINRKFDDLERRIVDESNDLLRIIDELRRDVAATRRDVAVRLDDCKERQATEDHCSGQCNDCVCK